MPTSSVENSSHKMLYNRGINNTLAWKVTQNWQVTVLYSLITLCWLQHLSATLIYDSLHLELLYRVILWRTTDQQSHAQFLFLTVLCMQRAIILFLRGQNSSQQLEAAEHCLWIKRPSSTNSKAVNQIPSSEKHKVRVSTVKREEAREQDVVTWDASFSILQ